ncbi:MAG: hypothetical protein H6724_09215 [Sandaracinus sp.]|nr:hypothetical protein [Sandaracinus sp.]
MSDIDDRDDWIDDPDLAPTEEELAEAEALAHALSRGTVKNGLEDAFPDDAFETAGLVAFSHDGGALSDAKLESILEGVFEEARPRPVEAPIPWWKRWMLPMGFASVGATAVVLFVLFRGPSIEGPVALPAPDGALLRAQAAAATGDDRDALDAQMGSYRGAVLAALEDRYAR